MSSFVNIFRETIKKCRITSTILRIKFLLQCKNMRKEDVFQFRITYCSVGVFHTVGVALLLILATLYLLFPCRSVAMLYIDGPTVFIILVFCMYDLLVKSDFILTDLKDNKVLENCIQNLTISQSFSDTFSPNMLSFIFKK